MNKAFLLIGGNLGDRFANLKNAHEKIILHCGPICQFSSFYETEAWGFKEQPAFLNQLIIIETLLNPTDLMNELLSIESSLGRQRTVPLGPRTIDIDIIYFNNEVIDNKIVTLPHPRIAERKFVLIPLVEIAPHFIHPVFGLTNSELLKNCEDISYVYKKERE